jgi:hypothetical protein
MDFTKDALTYALLLIPTFFASAMFAQGINKLSKDDQSGKTGIGFGLFLLALIVAAYLFFIR